MIYPFSTEEVIALAQRAGQEVLRIYENGFTVSQKADLSPVTQADVACEEVIFNGLKALTPDIPVVGEEHVAAGVVPVLGNRCFWLVDPIDGTKEFINKNGEFTVNIAFIDGDAACFGVVYAPAAKELYFTQSPTQAFSVIDGKTTLLKTRRASVEGVVVLCSRSHFDADMAQKMLGALPVSKIVRRGSSLKFCDIAAGRGDFYPCTHETSEWDTAAAHAVLHAAGGVLTDMDGNELTYRKTGFHNPRLLACGDASVLKRR